MEPIFLITQEAQLALSSSLMRMISYHSSRVRWLYVAHDEMPREIKIRYRMLKYDSQAQRA
jgi:hypothetical protein